MSEWNDLLASVANTISTYREGEVARPTPVHVERWVSQFSRENQLDFLREFNHVSKQLFINRENVLVFIEGLITNDKIVNGDPVGYWSRANFLRIQTDGQSQKEMVELFGQALGRKLGLDISKCGAVGGDYIYLDDVMFTGSRISTDLEKWIGTDAPRAAHIQAIFIATHSGGVYFADKVRLSRAISDSGKAITTKFWRAVEFKNKRVEKDRSQVLWPAVIPNLSAVEEYLAAEKKYPLSLRLPGGDLGFFSSESGRQILESEFLNAGVKIRSQGNIKPFLRPLGCGNFGAGFGSLITTYRNCPNNAPLALWWGDAGATGAALNWYPLLPRKTYSSAVNIFGILNDFDDF